MEQPPVKTIVRFLREWMGEEPKVQYEAFGADVLLRIGKNRLLIEYEEFADAASVRQAIRALRLGHDEGFITIVAVPFMGEVGMRICKEANVSWIDLSGNADITADHIRILILGKPKRVKARKKLSNVFAPRSSRVSRLLLQYPFTSMRQIEIGRRTGLTRSFVSQIVSRMLKQGLVRKLSDATIKCDDPELLLKAWDESYEFGRHNIVRGHVASHSGTELMTLLQAHLKKASIKHAFTGLSALHAYSDHGSFRLVSVYVSDLPDEAERSGWVFGGEQQEEEGEKEANIWFVVPNDDGVFHGAKQEAGFSCVHPVQLYLDLKSHPEPAKEAKEDLRSLLFSESDYAAGISSGLKG